MTNTNATTLRKNLFGMLATLELSSDKTLREKILSAKEENLDDCVSMDEVKW